MREDEAINFLETLEVGTFLTVNIPISPNQSMPVTAMYAGKDKDGRYEFLDTGEFILSKDFLEKGKISIEKEFDDELDNIINRISKNRKAGKTTYIFIDEIYLLFQHQYTSLFMSKLWKRIRKYGGCATGITQNIEEIIENKKAKLMLSNSELIIMLNQSTSDRDRLAELLHILDTELNFITNSGTGEGLIKVRNSIVPFVNKFPKNTELYKLMTTKPKENL